MRYPGVQYAMGTLGTEARRRGTHTMSNSIIVQKRQSLSEPCRELSSQEMYGMWDDKLTDKTCSENSMAFKKGLFPASQIFHMY